MVNHLEFENGFHYCHSVSLFTSSSGATLIALTTLWDVLQDINIPIILVGTYLCIKMFLFQAVYFFSHK